MPDGDGHVARRRTSRSRRSRRPRSCRCTSASAARRTASRRSVELGALVGRDRVLDRERVQPEQPGDPLEVGLASARTGRSRRTSRRRWRAAAAILTRLRVSSTRSPVRGRARSRRSRRPFWRSSTAVPALARPVPCVGPRPVDAPPPSATRRQHRAARAARPDRGERRPGPSPAGPRGRPGRDGPAAGRGARRAAGPGAARGRRHQPAGALPADRGRAAGRPRRRRREHVDDRLGECGTATGPAQPLKDLAKDPLWKVVQAHPSAVTFPGAAGSRCAAMQQRAVDAVRDWNARLGPGATWVARQPRRRDQGDRWPTPWACTWTSSSGSRSTRAR